MSSPLESLPVEEVPRCPLHPGATAARDRALEARLGLVPPHGVLRCPACRLAWLSPRPTAEGYEVVYRYDLYFEGGSPESYARLAEIRRPYFERRLARIEARMGRGLRVLDVGAATGGFVAAARARGHAAEGYEPAPGAREEAERLHGVALHGGALDELGPPGGWDVVHLNHVLEHLPAPLATLARLRSLLRAGGLLVVEVPQQFDNDVERLKRWLGRARAPRFDAYSLHHTFFFAPGNLRETLAHAGFVTERLRTWSPAQTPLRPFSWKNLALTLLLSVADRLHAGGSILEAWARPAEGGERRG